MALDDAAAPGQREPGGDRVLVPAQTGQNGAGTKVGVIDVGFDGIAAAQASGDLPPTGSGLTENDSNCADPTASPHGTATAEVVADMAPQAQLYLA